MDSMKEDWAKSERDHPDSEGPVDQEEPISVMSKAVQELKLS